MDKLFSAKCCLLGFENYRPIGDLYCDYDLASEKILKYFIREYYVNNGYICYNDFPIDSSTVETINYSIDLSSDSDITYCAGEYITNE